MLFRVNPQSFNAVTACAAKDDVRYFLNTFFIDTDNQRLVATNGHILAFAPLKEIETNPGSEPDNHKSGKGFLFKALDRPISNSGDRVLIDCARLELVYQSGRSRKIVKLEKADGVFPDYDRVKYTGDTQAVEEIYFQPHYVAKMAKWAGLEHSKAVFSFNGQTDSMGVRLPDPELVEVHITLMPCRM